MAKLITVFGATGKQGSSVIRAIQADPALKTEFSIRGVTRDVSKPAAKELEKKGVEVVAVRASRSCLTSNYSTGVLQYY